MTLAEGSLIVPALPDLVWGTISFIVVAVAIYKLAWPAFMRNLDERTEKIEEGLNAADRAREEIAAERVVLASQVDEAQREAARIRENAQASAAAIVDDAKKNAAAEAARITEQAQRQIEADSQVAKTQLRQEVGALASDLAGKIVGKQMLDPAVSSGVIDAFLDGLEAENASVSSTSVSSEGR